MCFFHVKEEEDFSAPARVVRRQEISPPRRSATRIILQERQASPEASTYIIQPPEPSVHASEHYSEKARSEKTRSEKTRPPTIPPPPQSTRGSTHTHSNFVRVEEDVESSSSESSSSEGVKSKSAKSHKTSHSKKTSASKAPGSHAPRSNAPMSEAPRSEYDVREREYRRERYSPPERIPERRSRDDYDTYRYVNAPRTSYGEDPRRGSTSYRREMERVMVVENDARSRGGYGR